MLRTIAAAAAAATTLALVLGSGCAHEPESASGATPPSTPGAPGTPGTTDDAGSSASPRWAAPSSPAEAVSPVADATTAPTSEPPAPPPTGTTSRCLRPLALTPPPLPPKAASCPHDTYKHVPPLGHGRVAFENLPGTTVKVEIARRPESTERGLMFRTAMAEYAGMLFELRERTEHQFWMHNTCIPLDLLFVDTDGTLVGVVEAAVTLDDTPLTVGCFSDRVLEVNAGWTRRHGVKPGDKLVLVTEPASK